MEFSKIFHFLLICVSVVLSILLCILLADPGWTSAHVKCKAPDSVLWKADVSIGLVRAELRGDDDGWRALAKEEGTHSLQTFVDEAPNSKLKHVWKNARAAGATSFTFLMIALLLFIVCIGLSVYTLYRRHTWNAEDETVQSIQIFHLQITLKILLVVLLSVCVLVGISPIFYVSISPSAKEWCDAVADSNFCLAGLLSIPI
eukprot:TRINITY_DN1707_c0_g1_i1.p1 TRINITY_DN1707_c0_g1~~TRINITY_DN1707_c0_g1_i1.p1  ORF type:complete len:202 (+),score=32.38 TRINITY_DN1707_c0_g1_i1:125-730(+)